MINEIKFRDERPMFRGLHLNFSKEDGTPYKTIIIAGENGCGKTTILQDIAYILMANTFSYHGRVIFNTSDTRLSDFVFPNGIDSVNFQCYLNEKGSEQNVTFEFNDENFDSHSYFEFFNKFNLYTLYLKVQTSFINGGFGICEKAIQHFSDRVSDDNKKLSNFTLVNQNEICKSQDSQAKINNYREALGAVQFGNHCNNFFQDPEFTFLIAPSLCVKTRKGLVSVDVLSTGETQIVLRGCALNERDKQPDNNVLCLVDEPELSMHPRWQKRVLKYYQDLLSADKVDKNGNLVKNEKGGIEKEQTAQLIVATHSPYIIEEALKDKEDTLIIILKEKDGRIDAVNLIDPEFITKTSAEVNYIAFGIPEPGYLMQLYSYLQDLIKGDLNKCNQGSAEEKECSVEYCNIKIWNYIKNDKKEDQTKCICEQKENSYQAPKSKKETQYHTWATYIRKASTGIVLNLPQKASKFSRLCLNLNAHSFKCKTKDLLVNLLNFANLL